MRQEPGPLDGPSVLATSAGGSAVPAPAAATAAPGDATVALPRFAPLRVPRALRSLRWPEVELGPTAGRTALATITFCALAMVLFSTHGPTILVPRASQIFASWEAGPLYHLLGPVKVGATATNFALTGLILAMLASYLVALGALRTLPMRLVVGCIVAVQLILLLGPPFQLTDMFNYLGYARLGGLHGLNPYTHVIGQEMHDPVYHFATWAQPAQPVRRAVHGAVTIRWRSCRSRSRTGSSRWRPYRSAWSSSRSSAAAPGGWDAIRATPPRCSGSTRSTWSTRSAASTTTSSCSFPRSARCRCSLARRDRTAGAVLMLAVAVKFTRDPAAAVPDRRGGGRPAPARTWSSERHWRRSRSS